MKRIIHLVNSNIYSGLEKVAIDIIENLNEKYDFYYACKDGEIVDILKEKGIKRIAIDNINRKEILRLEREYKPDIIHAHDYTATLFCGLFLKRTQVISHLHNNPLWLRKKFHPYNYLLLLALNNNHVKKIYTVSDSIEKEYIFSKLVKKKINCIANPISRKQIIQKVNEKDYKKRYDICCVARLTEQKNPKKFIDIIENVQKYIPDINCIWVGKGELIEECKRLVKEKKLDKNIQFVGFKKNPYIYMAASKIFVLTSDWEGFGLVAFEALTLGLPCVVSKVGGLPQIVDENCGGLCLSQNQFKNKIIELLTNTKIYESIRENAIKKSKTLENLNEYMKKMDMFYEKIEGDININEKNK